MQDSLEVKFDLEKLFAQIDLNKSERRICSFLAACAYSETECSVETKLIALMCGIGGRQTRRVLKSLERKGLIKREPQFLDAERTKQTSNRITLFFRR
jgi:DNA-binding MarR family transcriptional regulator